MKYVVVSVYDRASQAFGRPVFTAALGQAIRSFQDEVNRVGEGNEVNRHPADFDLYELGSFDDSVGSFAVLPAPKLVGHATAYKLVKE